MKFTTTVFGELDKLIVEHNAVSHEPFYIAFGGNDLAKAFNAMAKLNLGRMTLLHRPDTDTHWKNWIHPEQTGDMAKFWNILTNPKTSYRNFSETLGKFRDEIMFKHPELWSLQFVWIDHSKHDYRRTYTIDLV